ncbi:putative diguanylate cyclase/phosphodiesterase [Actinoplanes missouriensis 431]|uniref:Putative diguanylate cyclase/phosphodiesterase n=1 Tax=Actinoplanes missouriensis (strain ATCC 14538 / DSM 43046 / CBS 188.64 / JCM 3121 / NBRC 102363 / NCIMB 12654 / NRRL B-3342 / UNCC 431) TaxID=512565 RepID=I0HCZ7_ACTM4|nr:EAL domain-containing protein [Actinoplanes missouriensis]BAL90884.1 putative diguanylate cyclase/phosphodiesterase [Actinoplanes missouriensis 431]
MGATQAAGLVRHLWWIYLAVTSVAAAAYLMAPVDAATRWIYVAVNSTAPIATWYGLVRHAPRRRLGWQLIATGLAASALGDVLFASYTSRGLTAPFPSVADALYLLGHLAIAAGTAALAARAGRTAFIDAAIIVAPLAGLAWLVVLDPIHTLGGTPLAQFVAISAPASTLFVVYCALALALGIHLRTIGARALLLGLFAWFVSDTLYTQQSLAGTYAEGSAIDLGWMAMPILIATAALHPSMVVTTPRRSALVMLTVPRAVTLFSASLVLPTVHLFWGPEPDTPLIIGAAVAMSLVAIRLIAPIHELARRAAHDPLTGLANRSLLMDRLALALGALPVGGSTRTGLLFCDLDHFKMVNDSLGHDAGDKLLVAIADRLRDTVRGGDLVCRLGGDEFVVLMPAVTEADADAVAARIAERLAEPLRLADGSEFFASLSIGLRTTGDGSDDPDALLQDADIAMYQAKSTGRGRTVRFDAQSRAEAAQRLRRDADFRRALHHPGELFCVYQPVYRVDDGSLSSVEALARWRHPRDGILLPAAFVPMAEATGMVAALFAAVLEQALHEQRTWYNRTGGWIPIAVNLSPRQLDATTTEAVLTALRRAGTPAAALTLELTETGLAEPETVEAALGPLRRAGVKLAVDDFGTGYSSMARVADHGWDIVKIDRTFVSGIAADPARRSLADAMVGMAHALGMVSVAEGVEDPADMAVLRELGCEYAQGFLLAHPLDATEILDHIAAAEQNRLALVPPRG